MTIRDIVVAFGFEVDRNSERSAQNSITGIKNFATKVLGAIGIGFSIAGISGLAEAAANVEALESQFSQVFGGIESEAEKRLQAISDDTGVHVNRMKGSFSGIAAFAKVSGVEQAEALELSERAMAAVADSAAYYDRSIEQVTESLQSFLKGNYENDAALGLSATETTRNTAANALYGKSFKDLSEAEKQFTLLKMVEDANAASGALGQAARESDTWTNQLGNLKQELSDLKAAAGAGILKPAVTVLKVLISLTQKVKVALQEATKKNGIFTKSFDRLFALVKKLKPAIDRMMQTMSLGASRGMTFIKGVVDRLGGMGNVLKILASLAGAFFAVMTFAKAITTAKTMLAALKAIDKAMMAARLKVFALVAVLAILGLIVEDFVQFLLGNDSVIGSMFDQAGIGADHARQLIFDAFHKVKDFLQNTWKWITTTVGQAAADLKGAIDRHMGSILDSISKIWGGIQTILSVVWANISGLARLVFGGLLSFFGDWQLDLSGVFEAIVSAVDGVLQVFGAVGEWISEHEAVIDVLVTVLGSVAAVFGIIQAAILAYNVVAGICAAVSAAMAAGLSLLSVAAGALAGVIAFLTSPITLVIAAIAALIAIGVLLYKNWESISSFFSEIFTEIYRRVSGTIQNIKEHIIQGFSEAVSFIRSLPGQAIQWGSDFIQGLLNGMVSLLGAIAGLVKNGWKAVIQFLCSLPSQAVQWGSDFIQGLLDGISFMISAVSGTVGVIVDVIKNRIQEGIDFLCGLPSQAFQWGADFIAGLGNGILSGVGAVVDAVKGVGDKIRSFLHFSVPDEGPLTDYESWMPDFMSGLAGGIAENESLVLDKVRGLADSIAALTQATTAQAATAANSTINNTSSSVTQNVNINNSYRGGSMETQKNVSKAMKKSASDATTYMARGLAYARG